MGDPLSNTYLQTLSVGGRALLRPAAAGPLDVATLPVPPDGVATNGAKASSWSAATSPSRTPPGSGSGRRSRSKRTRFAAHWERERLQAALKTGGAFRAPLRFNACDRTQAFATLPGLRSDIMVRGAPAQNRAVEGDEVALRLLPLAQWFELRGDGDGWSSGRGFSSAGCAWADSVRAAGQPCPERSGFR
ncbi:hypothetical protein WJX81_002294 [Elliptochloris bilobata]|uniref:Uncharacterized protein n=1 Tax=Elliptochloris bilobata TaxID=381761 RepID=A0AAW1SIG4_9CHLO